VTTPVIGIGKNVTHFPLRKSALSDDRTSFFQLFRQHHVGQSALID
jgi:hypothetical protein